MFDIGFWELTLVSIVALLVIGPERLPGVARSAGLWLGRARRMAAVLKEEIDQELRAEELKQTLLQHSPAEAMRDLVEDAAKSTSPVPPDSARKRAPQEDAELTGGNGFSDRVRVGTHQAATTHGKEEKE